MKELILRKEKIVSSNGTKPVFIDAELHKQIKALKEETDIPMTRIIDSFLRYGINNVVIKEDEEE